MTKLNVETVSEGRMTFIIRLYLLVIMKSERISDGSELSLRDFSPKFNGTDSYRKALKMGHFHKTAHTHTHEKLPCMYTYANTHKHNAKKHIHTQTHTK